MSEKLRSELIESISTRLSHPIASAQPNRQGQATPPETQAVLKDLMHFLAPADMLEIGTFFADTAHVVAEEMAKLGTGHITTIDPFGGHRVPNIIAGWPSSVRERVTFRPDNSMSFFLYLDEELRVKRGNQAPFNIIYVDGHHAFEYALFDLMRSSLYLRPGGVFVVDNIELAGPAAAIRLFLERNTHWKLFKAGGAEADKNSLAIHSNTNSALILAPEGVEVGSLPYLVDLFDLQLSEIRQLQVKVRKGAPGLLRAVTCLYSRPPDYAYSGKGEQNRIGVTECKTSDGAETTLVIPNEPILALSPNPGDRIAAQIEFSFAPEGPDNLLLDADPVSVA
jgi:predicted O-methyltransferase YrrM